MTAAAIILKRCWPEFRGRPVRPQLPAITAATDLVTASAAVVAAVAGGHISPEEGQAVSAVIETQRRTMEPVELAARVEALERSAGSR